MSLSIRTARLLCRRARALPLIRVSLFVAGCSMASCFIDDCDRHVSDATKCWSPYATNGTLDCSTRATGGTTGAEMEPNGILPLATEATAVVCSQDQMEGVVGGSDVDIFHFEAQICDDRPPPWIELVADGPDTAEVQACLFLACRTGSTALGIFEDHLPGCVGGEATHLPEGVLGCCAAGPGRMQVRVRCSNRTDKLDGYVVVDGPGDRCVHYTVRYGL